MLELFSNPQTYVSVATLTFLEVVLGIDNIIVIAIQAGSLPVSKQAFARKMGLFLALFTRICLLWSIAWVMKLTTELFTLFHHGFTGKDLILVGGGLFLIVKSVQEIHNRVEGEEGDSSSLLGEKAGQGNKKKKSVSLPAILVQIMMVDIVFSLDSVITAVGMVSQVPIMITAMVLSMLVMLWLSGVISDFVNRHPTLKILALSFLLLIGVVLIADGFGQHIDKSYIYFAMGFSVAVEAINLRIRRKQHK